MGADRAEVWDVLERPPVPTLPAGSEVEAAPRGVESEDKGLGVCCFREKTQSLLILLTLWSWKTHSLSDQDEQKVQGLSLEQRISCLILQVTHEGWVSQRALPLC